MTFKYYVVLWDKWEGFTFMSVPTFEDMTRSSSLSGFVRTLVLEVPNEVQE